MLASKVYFHAARFAIAVVILPYVIVRSAHNSCLWFADKCCKTSFTHSTLNRIHHSDNRKELNQSWGGNGGLLGIHGIPRHRPVFPLWLPDKLVQQSAQFFAMILWEMYLNNSESHRTHEGDDRLRELMAMCGWPLELKCFNLHSAWWDAERVKFIILRRDLCVCLYTHRDT